ncbi:MAG: histidinol dehydrogenase [Pseudanabaenaceae cyanobacterium]
MLRIVTQRAEAEAELRRIRDRLFGLDNREAEQAVAAIVQAVQQEGDAALCRYTETFDRVSLQPEELRVSPTELDAAYQQISGKLLKAIELAHRQIVAFHRLKVPQSWVHFPGKGVVLGKRYTPVDRAGVYVPGGRALYPSTVLMNVVPAVVAGVPRIVMVTPPGADKTVHPALLVAAQIAGVDEIYRVGGAQAIAALAFGTATLPAVDVITGPGNIYVTLAKKRVYGRVGIDSLAGPSEVAVVADRTAHPEFIAADLLAQAEHDPMAAAVLITPDAKLAIDTAQAVQRQLVNHPRQILTEKAIGNNSLAIVVDDLPTAFELVNLLAPEHLELEIADPWDWVDKVRHAGAIFLGHYTPEAVGDYLAGPNHTLPTCGAARFASSLGVETFLKNSSLVEYHREALAEVAGAIAALTEAEGLPSHGDSVRLRLAE